MLQRGGILGAQNDTRFEIEEELKQESFEDSRDLRVSQEPHILSSRINEAPKKLNEMPPIIESNSPSDKDDIGKYFTFKLSNPFDDSKYRNKTEQELEDILEGN